MKFDSEMHVDLVQHMAHDGMVINAAKVSMLGDGIKEHEPINMAGMTNGTRLIEYLMRHRHGTPFEHGMFTFRVTVPIFVMRELHRHRVGMSYNEESGRYRKLEPHFYVPKDNRPLRQAGKPGQYFCEFGDDGDLAIVTVQLQSNAILAWSTYKRLLDFGIAREVSRMALPLNIYSSCYVTCNPRSLMHFLSLRVADEDADYPSTPLFEIDQMARKMESYFAELMPVTHKAFDDYGRVAP